MTKIKNTKKGMTKKTLSMSLVVAMLATSNVPVWAADFSDGTDAAVTAEAEAPAVETTEDFTDDAAVETTEAPVVEETADAPAVQAEDSKYTVEVKDLASEVEWGKPTTVKVKITDANDATKNVTTSMKVRVLEDGLAVDGYEAALSSYRVEDGYSLISINLGKEFVGKKVQLQFFEGTASNMTWEAKSAEFTVAKRKVSGTVTFNEDAANAARYTGSQITAVPFDRSNIALNGVDAGDTVEYGNWTITGDDTVNSWNVSNKYLTATAEIVSDYYTGEVTGQFRVWRKSVTSADDAAKAELSNYTFEYTGTDIKVPAKDITITDKVTGQAVKDAAKDLTIDKDVKKTAKENVKVGVDMTKGSLANIALNDNDFPTNATLTLANDVEVKARDLSNTANTKISVGTITTEKNGTKLTADQLKNKLTITDGAGNNLNAIRADIDVEFENGATELTVESGKTYTAVVKATRGNTNVVNTQTITFAVVAHDLNDAKFANESTVQGQEVEYTGEQITFGLTASNLTQKLGTFTSENNTVLSAGTDYDVNVEFGENTNVGTGTITINGKGSYAGTKKVLTFTIKPRTTITKTTVNVPETVLYDDSLESVEDYKLATSLTVEFTENGKNYTLTVPESDYKVTYTGTNTVNTNITTTVEQKANVKSNFEFNTATGTTKIANKAITDADVQLNKTEYTYTGAAIIPDYTVTVDGVTLVKGTDYTETVTYNTEVGEATLKVTGKGNYDNKSVTKKFNIVAANINDLTVTAKEDSIVYDGTQHVGSDTTRNLVFKLGDNTIDASQFTVTYPKSKTANINAGEGTVTLKPAKDNKNFTGEKEFTFTIDQATLTGGTLTAYDKNGTKVSISSKTFDYDGTAHEFDRLVYTNTNLGASRVLTADDYEIIYKDNVEGDANGNGHVLVVAKGNYKTDKTYTDTNKDKVENVVLNQTFIINQSDISQHTDITVENGAYNGGFDVEPKVTVSYKGKALTEGVDYKLDYSNYTQDRKNVTNGKTLKVDIVGMGGYTGTVTGKTWGIDKFDFTNANVLVTGTAEAPVVTVMNGSVVVDAAEYDVTYSEDGKKLTVSAKADSKNYTGSQVVDVKFALTKPATPVIADAKTAGNKVTVTLENEAEGATAYDYVISADNDLSDEEYVAELDGQVATDVTFNQLEQGSYYAFCRAWTRDENGKKVYSDWSEGKEFEVTAVTPETPQITKVTSYEKNGSYYVTVTYTASENAEKYGIILGTKQGRDSDGQLRPLNYGTMKKNNVNADKTTVTFKVPKKGTYYAGLRAYNKSGEDGKKVYSNWSNVEPVSVPEKAE